MVTHKGIQSQQQVNCQRTKTNLLGLPAIIALNTAAQIQKAKKSDLLCSLVIKHNCTGWPGKDQALALHWEPREMLHYVGAFYYGTWIVVPASMMVQTLSKLHEGHQDIDSPHFPHSNEMLERQFRQRAQKTHTCCCYHTHWPTPLPWCDQIPQKHKHRPSQLTWVPSQGKGDAISPHAKITWTQGTYIEHWKSSPIAGRECAWSLWISEQLNIALCEPPTMKVINDFHSCSV